ncbi:MAG: LysM peptidoglycan-binding domain-containing protein [Candidatus Thiodiazotropha sp.]
MSHFNNKLIGVICGLVLSFTAFAAEHVALNPSHPDRYTVVKGDTLWDISAMFLRDPWLWPEVWYVNPQIENPHLIYPGDEIVLSYLNGRPVLRVKRKNKLSPQIRATPLDQAIPTIPIDAIAPFLTRPYVVEENELDGAPYIVHFLDDHILGGGGISYYARSIMDDDYKQYAIVRPEKPYKDPDTSEILGFEALYVGTSELQRTGDPAKLFINSSETEAIIGDRLIRMEEEEPLIDFKPKVPDGEFEGRIISVLNGVSQIGQYNIVVLNKGANVGLEPGHVLEILQGGNKVRDIVRGRGETVTLPLEKAGLLMVFRTFEKVSFALVMDASKPLHVLDWVRPPASR